MSSSKVTYVWRPVRAATKVPKTLWDGLHVYAYAFANRSLVQHWLDEVYGAEMVNLEQGLAILEHQEYFEEEFRKFENLKDVDPRLRESVFKMLFMAILPKICKCNDEKILVASLNYATAFNNCIREYL